MMKRFLLPMVFFLLALAAGAQTPVQFPITAMVGQSGYSGTMTLTPTATLLFGPGGFQVGTPARVNIYGTNPVVYLQPNTYKVGFSGTAATFYIVVPASTNTLNATNLLTLQPIYALANGVVTTNGATAAGQVPVLSPGSTGGIAWQAQSGGGGGSANLSNGVASYLTTNPVSGAVSVNVATNTFDLAGAANQVGANGTNLVNTVSNTVLNLATNFAAGMAQTVVDTNTLIVTGAGTLTANGVYYQGANGTWTEAVWPFGQVTFNWGGQNIIWSGSGGTFDIYTNSNPISVGYVGLVEPGSWYAVPLAYGTNPAPLVQFATYSYFVTHVEGVTFTNIYMTNGAALATVKQYDPLGAAAAATNGLGGAAYVPTNTFDLAGAANAATNTLSASFRSILGSTLWDVYADYLYIGGSGTADSIPGYLAANGQIVQNIPLSAIPGNLIGTASNSFALNGATNYVSRIIVPANGTVTFATNNGQITATITPSGGGGSPIYIATNNGTGWNPTILTNNGNPVGLTNNGILLNAGLLTAGAFGGTGTNQFDLAGLANQVGANVTNAISNSQPVITLSATGIATGGSTTNGGKMYGPDTPGTVTCGIQEAINAINSKASSYSTANGGLLQFSPGVYTTKAQINMLGTNCTYVFEGSGLESCGIVYVGATNCSVLYAAQSDPSTVSPGFFCRNMFLTSSNDMSGFIIQTYTFSRFELKNCWLGFYPFMQTNGQNGFTTPIQGSPASAYKLIGVYLEGQSADDIATISGCSFNGLACGLINEADHSVIENNMFSYCGRNSGTIPNVVLPASFSAQYSYTNNLNMASLGVCIVEGHSGHNDSAYNNNYFYGGNYCYGMDDGTGSTFEGCISTRDGLESMAGFIYISPQSHFTSIDMHTDGNVNHIATAINNVYYSGTLPYATQTTNLNLNLKVFIYNNTNNVITGVSNTVWSGIFQSSFAGNGAGLTNIPTSTNALYAGTATNLAAPNLYPFGTNDPTTTRQFEFTTNAGTVTIWGVTNNWLVGSGGGGGAGYGWVATNGGFGANIYYTTNSTSAQVAQTNNGNVLVNSNVGIGGDLTIAGNGGTGANGPIYVNSSTTFNNSEIAGLFSSSVAGTMSLGMGTALHGSYNEGELMWGQSGASSAQNSIGLGIYNGTLENAKGLIWVNGAGVVTSSGVVNVWTNIYAGAVVVTNGFVSYQPTAASFQWSLIPPYSATQTNSWFGTWTNGQLSVVYSNTSSTFLVKPMATYP